MTLPLVIGLDDTWYLKGSNGPVFFFRQVMVLKKFFVPLNSASVRIKYNQIFQSSFGGDVGILQIFKNKNTEMMCYYSEK